MIVSLVFAMVDLQEISIEKCGTLLAVSLDISKACSNSVWHVSLLNKLPAHGVTVGFCIWIDDFLRVRSIHVVVDGDSFATYVINTCVPQGSTLSVTLSLLHINNLLLMSGIFRYAKDSTRVEGYMPPLIFKNYCECNKPLFYLSRYLLTSSYLLRTPILKGFITVPTLSFAV